jgi:hypothetical protein
MKRLFWILQCGGWGIFFAGMFLAGIGQWPVGYTLVKKLSITPVLFVGYGDGVPEGLVRAAKVKSQNHQLACRDIFVREA